jgi:hypothetical protein
MIDRLIAAYEQGGITGHHLAVEALALLDPSNPRPTLAALPPDVWPEVHRYAVNHQSGRMRSNYGPSPTVEQVEAARRWLEANVPAERLGTVAGA